MKKYDYLVFSKPVAGKEEEYNRWYNEQHLGDVLRVPGFVAAQRYSVEDGAGPNGCRNLAIYELVTENPAAVLADLNSRANTDAMPLTDALDFTSISTQLVTRVGARKVAEGVAQAADETHAPKFL